MRDDAAQHPISVYPVGNPFFFFMNAQFAQLTRAMYPRPSRHYALYTQLINVYRKHSVPFRPALGVSQFSNADGVYTPVRHIVKLSYYIVRLHLELAVVDEHNLSNRSDLDAMHISHCPLVV